MVDTDTVDCDNDNFSRSHSLWCLFTSGTLSGIPSVSILHCWGICPADDPTLYLGHFPAPRLLFQTECATTYDQNYVACTPLLCRELVGACLR